MSIIYLKILILYKFPCNTGNVLTFKFNYRNQFTYINAYLKWVLLDKNFLCYELLIQKLHTQI